MNWPLGWTSLESMKHENWQWWKESSAAYIQSGVLLEMWFNRDPSASPQGSESDEQLTGECGDSLPTMPQGGSHDGWDVGAREGGACDLQSLQHRVSAEANAPIFDMRQPMPVGMGATQRCEALEYVPRVTTGVIARADRLKALGNGQVPRVAATAFDILRGAK